MKNFRLLLCSLFLTVLGCASHLQDISPSALDENIVKVKIWYESTLEVSTPVQKSDEAFFGKAASAEIPDWDRAVATDVRGRVIVSVPVKSRGRSNMVKMENSNRSPKGSVTAVFRSLLISPHGNDFSLSIVDIIPNNPEDIQREGGFIDYFKLIEDGFNGRMIYAFRNGDFAGGHVFKDGKRVASMSNFSKDMASK